MISQVIRGRYVKLLTKYFRNRKYNNILPVFVIPPALWMHSTIFFFISKIDKIHNAFTERAPENDLISFHTTDRPLCDMHQVTLDMVKKFAVKTLTKSCDLDPLPASVLKTCFPILPMLTSIINMSLKKGVMPLMCFESCCIETASQETRC